MARIIVGLVLTLGLWYGALILTAHTSQTAQAPQTIAGRYTCEGTNPDGSMYKGEVEITARKDLWALAWTFSQGGGIGVGLLNAEGGILSVVFQTSDGTLGLASYRVERQGPSVRLVGRWTVPGDPDGHVLTETLTVASLRAAR